MTGTTNTASDPWAIELAEWLEANRPEVAASLKEEGAFDEVVCELSNSALETYATALGMGAEPDAARELARAGMFDVFPESEGDKGG